MWVVCLVSLFAAFLSALTPHGIDKLWTDDDDRPLWREWLDRKGL